MPTSPKPAIPTRSPLPRSSRRPSTPCSRLPPTPPSKQRARPGIDARVPYMQTEAFRFGNKIVDDWEGRVNSWPLDEGLIDYVGEAYGSENPENELYAADVIAQQGAQGRRQGRRRHRDHTGTSLRHAAGGGGRRGQRGHRLSRRRVPALGARTRTAPVRAPATAPRPTTNSRTAPAATATGAPPT